MRARKLALAAIVVGLLGVIVLVFPKVASPSVGPRTEVYDNLMAFGFVIVLGVLIYVGVKALDNLGHPKASLPSPDSYPAEDLLDFKAQYAAMRRRHAKGLAVLMAWAVLIMLCSRKIATLEPWQLVVAVVAGPMILGFVALAHNARCPACRHIIMPGGGSGWSKACPYCGVELH